jgi:hypothetical protein
MQLLEIPSITPDLLLEELVLSEAHAVVRGEAVVALTQAAINETLLMPEMTDGNPSGPQPGGKGRERPQGPSRPPSRP